MMLVRWLVRHPGDGWIQKGDLAQVTDQNRRVSEKMLKGKSAS